MLERLSLNSWAPPWVRHEHLARYRWACQFVPDLDVIDAACGTGYGADIMVREGKATSVAGFDIAGDAIADARRDFSNHDGLAFHAGDATKLPVMDGCMDVFTSFETIEHLSDDRALLAEAVRVLKPSGRFICSTPNRALFHPGASLADQPLNRHHVREYSRNEFESLLSEYFSAIEWFGQTFFTGRYGKLLQIIGRHMSTVACRLHQMRKLATALWRSSGAHYPKRLVPGVQPEIFIAVCSNC
jgi:SAM-dependent methyltransferase